MKCPPYKEYQNLRKIKFAMNRINYGYGSRAEQFETLNDRMLLKVYEWCSTQIEDKRYKVRDPDGWEADQIVKSAEKCVAKSRKKEPLSDKRLAQLTYFLAALEVVVEKRLGRYSPRAAMLVKTISFLLGPEKSAIAELMNSIIKPMIVKS